MTRLAILHRCVVDARGRERVERLVDCPARRHCIPIAACDRCGFLRGEAPDEETGGYDLECACEGAVDPVTDAYPTELRVVPVLAVASLSVLGVDRDAPVERVRHALTQGAVGCVVVMDGIGSPLGIITAVDLLDRPDGETAAEIMKRDVVTVTGMTPITRAAAVMAYEGIHHLPVVNDAGEVIGVLSSLDVLRHVAKEGGFIVGRVSVRCREAEERESRA